MSESGDEGVMIHFGIDEEDAKVILEGIWRLDSEGLLSDSMHDLGIRLLKVYFPDEKRPWWVREGEW